MSYEPRIKNLPLFLKDLSLMFEGQIDSKVLYNKTRNFDYEFDYTDGFEDVLDIVRPFIKNYDGSNRHKQILRELIDLLKNEVELEVITQLLLC